MPAKRIDDDVDALLQYTNTSDDDIYIKSAIAHLWFVTTHPYDDGNGRMARIISDYIISKYVAMIKTSLVTAKRDIQELMKLGCLHQIEGTQGRNIRYDIVY